MKYTKKQLDLIKELDPVETTLLEILNEDPFYSIGVMKINNMIQIIDAVQESQGLDETRKFIDGYFAAKLKKEKKAG